MGTTSYYALPYPDPTSSVDVPRDIKALADKLELWKNGFTVPGGNIVAGSATDANAYMVIVRKLDPPDVYEGRIYIQTGSDWAFVLTKNNVEISRFRLTTTSEMGTGTSGLYRPIPFAQEAIANSISLSNVASNQKQINFSTDRFTQSPIVLVTPTAGGATPYVATTNSVGAASCNVNLRHMNDTLATATVNFHLLAVQMRATSGVGFRAEMEPVAYPTISVCRTKDCPNENVEIEGGGSEPEIAVACGPCGQDVTDIAPMKRKKR